MATPEIYNDGVPRRVKASVVTALVEMLRAEKLDEKFLSGAPDVPLNLSPLGSLFGTDQNELSDALRGSKLPTDAFKGIEGVIQNRNQWSTSIEPLDLTIDPALINYMKTFLADNKLDERYELAARLMRPTAGNGVDCPVGR